jgi:radical SAM PhpK family P-methyltransferase
MSREKHLDCIVIGYNEIPFQRYEEFLRHYGEDTEAYRDLKFSFIDLDGRKLDYIGLLNHVFNLASGDASHGGVERFKSGEIPNLAAVYLTNYLRRRGHHARYVNLFQHEKDKLVDFLKEDPYCVAITTTFYVVNLPVAEMVEFIRRHNSKVKIIVGGPLIANHHRNYHGDELKAALDDIGADIYVVEGQGEETLSRLVQCFKDGGNLGSIPNIIYYEDGRLSRTMSVAESSALDENAIDWRGFPEEDLGPTIQTRTARSCAFKCSFCNYPGRAGALTLAGVETVEKELESMRELGNVRNVIFIDDTFNVPLPRFKNLCRMMIDRKFDFNWFSYFRCSNSDEEAIELMARSGCKGVFLGIESGSPSILVNMNKSATIEKYAKGIDLLRKYGIMTFGSFIIGFPGETDTTVEETIEFIRQARPDYYRAQMWYSEPGTPIQHEKEKYDIRGEGFVWQHRTMDSMDAMDHIDRLFLSIEESTWLPQWSFDFWTIPYVLAKGIDFDRFKQLMTPAHKMLALEIASVPAQQKKSLQQTYLKSMVEAVKSWNLTV